MHAVMDAFLLLAGVGAPDAGEWGGLQSAQSGMFETNSGKVTGLAQKLQVGPRFFLQIPINGLKLAQLLGQLGICLTLFRSNTARLRMTRP